MKKKIVSLIPGHVKYIEVFGGAGWVLFEKTPDSRRWTLRPPSEYMEIYNDIDGELVNFWKYIKHHPKAFQAELSEQIYSRELFCEFSARPPLTELERAVIFYYRMALSFGGKNVNFAKRNGRRLTCENIEKVLEASKRLFKVTVENKDFAELIKRYDGEESFFYLDPPYYGKEKIYKSLTPKIFCRHEELAEILKGIKGKFLLSSNDDPFIRNLYKGFDVIEIDTKYTLSGKSNKTQAKEILVKNYKI